MFIFLLLSCVLISLYFNGMFKKKKYLKPPLYPGAMPVIGHTLQLLGDNEYICRLMYDIGDESNKNGGVLLLKVGWDDYYVVTDPDDFKVAANQCLGKHYSYQFLKPWLGSGMITGNDTSLWRRHRKLLNPAFSQHVIDGFLPIFNAMAKQLVENLKKEVGRGPFDHALYLDAISLKSICQTAFGITVGEEGNFNTNKYMEAVRLMLHISAERLISFWKHSDVLFGFSSLKKEQDVVADYLNKVCNEVLRVTKKKTNDEEIQNVSDRKFKAFMDLALELSSKSVLTEKEICEEMNTIIVAGYETTGNSLMYTMLLIGSHVNVQNKIYEEIQEVFGDSDRELEHQDLPRLPYLEAVLKESLRLYCITPVMLRTVDHDVKLKNYTLPAGSYCLLFNCSVHYHPAWGADARAFRPERWLDPTALADPKAPIHTAFTGFGVGKRLCMGKNYAVMSMKTTLTYVLRHFKLNSDVSQLKVKLDPLLKPVSGHHISLQFRK